MSRAIRARSYPAMARPAAPRAPESESFLAALLVFLLCLIGPAAALYLLAQVAS